MGVTPYFGGRRELAFLIDFGILLVLTVVLPFSFLGMIIGGLYMVVFRDAFNGQSVGKRLMKLQAVDFKTGKPTRFLKSFLRNITLIIAIEVPLMIVQEYYTRNPSHRRPGDYIAKTAVIKL